MSLVPTNERGYVLLGLGEWVSYFDSGIKVMRLDEGMT